MGGAGAPDSLEKGFATQVWLAVSDDAKATVTCHFKEFLLATTIYYIFFSFFCFLRTQL